MSLEASARRIADYEQIKTRLRTYSHPDDLASVIARAISHLSGAVQTDLILGILVDGMDELIRAQKNKLRDMLE